MNALKRRLERIEAKRPGGEDDRAREVAGFVADFLEATESERAELLEVLTPHFQAWGLSMAELMEAASDQPGGPFAKQPPLEPSIWDKRPAEVLAHFRALG